MTNHAPLSATERLELVRSAMSGALGTSAAPRARLTELVVSALASEMPEPEVLKYMASQLRYGSEFASISVGVVHLQSLLDSIEWTVMVDGYDAAVDDMTVDDQLAPIEWWTRSEGKLAANEHGQLLGRVRRLTIHTEPDDFDDDDDLWEPDRVVMRGPSDWLSSVAGGWAVLTTKATTLHVASSRSVPRPSERQARAIGIGFARAIVNQPAYLRSMSKDRDVCSINACIVEAVAADRPAFLSGPVAPVDHLLGVAGLWPRHGFASRDVRAA